MTWQLLLGPALLFGAAWLSVRIIAAIAGPRRVRPVSRVSAEALATCGEVAKATLGAQSQAGRTKVNRRTL